MVAAHKDKINLLANAEKEKLKLASIIFIEEQKL